MKRNLLLAIDLEAHTPGVAGRVFVWIRHQLLVHCIPSHNAVPLSEAVQYKLVVTLPLWVL